MSLDQWQKDLHEHFHLLTTVRMETADKNPVFALEHGLNQSNLDSLNYAIRAHIVEKKPLDSHWLPWVVYAAEIGYDYEGEQYWQTFESQTPGWNRFGYKYRGWIKTCYIRFRDEFQGIEPKGPWAKKFSNICWPIRHAILPKDLQHQLAKALFDLRIFFRSGEIFDSPLTLGTFLAAHCRTGTKRFLRLLENPLLVGQISFALLLQGDQISEELLLKETQDRIVADLSKEKIKQTWLEGAQREAISTYKGLRSQASMRVKSRRPSATRSVTVANSKIYFSPNLLLYPIQSTKEWEVKLELQDLTVLGTRFPDLRSVFSENYFTIAGTDGTPQARGMLLRPGPHRFNLVRFPSSEEVLVCFENAPEILNEMFLVKNIFSSSSTHLFKISAENIAYEVRMRTVRPGNRYIILSKDPLPNNDSAYNHVKVNCEGVHAATVTMPKEISSALKNTLKDIGLTCIKSLSVWPVGLPAKEWDEEGYGIWHVGERVRLGICTDYEISGLQIKVNTTKPNVFDVSASTGDPVFIDFSPLPVGENIIEIKAVGNHEPDNDLVGYIVAVIKDPKFWNPSQGAIRGYVDPETPSLEDIWENIANIELYGPPGRTVKCKFYLFDNVENQTILEKDILSLTLPLYSQKWKKHFTQSAKKHSKVQEAYDVASSGSIHFDAEELGYFKVFAERRSKPIRWAVSTRGSRKEFKYVNETETENVEIYRYDFSYPDTPSRIDVNLNNQTLEYQEGGLFHIKGMDGNGDSIIIPPLTKKLGLADLNLVPVLGDRYQGNTGIKHLITLFDLWSESRISGNYLIEWWRREILRSITRTLGSLVGGDNWTEAENTYNKTKNHANFTALKKIINDKPNERYMGAALEKEAKKLSTTTNRNRELFLGGLCKQYCRILDGNQKAKLGQKIGAQDVKCSSDLLPGFSLRLFSSPNTTLSLEINTFEYLLECLFEFPVIARASRFLVLAVEKHCPASYEYEASCHYGWKWH